MFHSLPLLSYDLPIAMKENPKEKIVLSVFNCDVDV